MNHSEHDGHSMEPGNEMPFWKKLKVSMTMSMGMDNRFAAEMG